MSDAEKRAAQGRATVVAASLFAVVIGGQFIGTRVDAQKHEEAFRAGAHELNLALASQQEEATEAVQGGVRLASFTNSISAETLGLRTSRAPVKPRPAAFTYADFNLDPERARDARTLATLAAWSANNFNSAEGEERELNCLSEAIYYEARSEELRGQLAVAEVVMNRVRDSRFPKTVCGVVYQGHYRQTGCQFTFTCDGSLAHRPRGEPWERAQVVALHVIMGMAKPLTNKATHYHTDYVNPYWAAGMVETKVLGTHIFYRYPKTGPEWATARVALDVQAQHRDALEAVEAGAVFETAPAEQPIASAEPTLVPVAARPQEPTPAAAPVIAVTAAAAAASAL